MLKFHSSSVAIVPEQSDPDAREEDKPYGQKTILGWRVADTICKTPSEDVRADANFYRTAAKEDRHHFVFASKTKEIISPKSVIIVLAKYFNENFSERKLYFLQDSRFVRILECGIKTDIMKCHSH